MTEYKMAGLFPMANENRYCVVRCQRIVPTPTNEGIETPNGARNSHNALAAKPTNRQTPPRTSAESTRFTTRESRSISWLHEVPMLAENVWCWQFVTCNSLVKISKTQNIAAEKHMINNYSGKCHGWLKTAYYRSADKLLRLFTR